MLENMPKAFHLWRLAQSICLLMYVIGRKINPSNNAFDEIIFFRETEKKGIVFFRLFRLHGDATIEAIFLQQPLKFGGIEIAPKDFHPFANPGVCLWSVSPEMLVRVNSHCMISFSVSLFRDRRFQVPPRLPT